MPHWRSLQGKPEASIRLWTSSLAMLKCRSVVWSALFFGYAQRCWSWDPGDPCQHLLVSVASGAVPRTWVWRTYAEFIQCIRQDGTCQDLPLPCDDLECDAEYDLRAVVNSMYGNNAWPQERGSTHVTSVSAVCPLTCGVCGPRKNERPVNALVATIRRGPCGHEWSYADGACFKYDYGGQGGATRLHVTWFDAEESCQAEGAHLATVVTKAQEHLVFNLVQQRPAPLGRFGLWAWIGLWTGPMGCAHNSSNWTWIGTPSPKIGMAIPHSSFPTFCDPEFVGAAHAIHTNRLDHAKSFGFRSVQTRAFRRAWVCSKPALFHPVEGGLCQDSGLLPIHDLGACEAAAEVLLGINAYALRTETVTSTFGCQVSDLINGLRLNTEAASQTLRADQGVTMLCQSLNATDNTATNAGQRLEGIWEGVRAGDVSPSFSRPVIAALLVAGFLPAFGFVALRGDDVVALWRHVLLLVYSLCARVRKQRPGATDHFVIVAARLRQRRRTIANIVAVVVAGFHLLELVRICLVEESVCTRSSAVPQIRFLLALVHLGSLWVASLFWALTHWLEWTSSHLELVFLLAIVVLDVAQTALVGEQALLVQSRLYSQLLWRLLLGACTTPAIALLGNVLYMTGSGIVYKVLIPDGLIFTVGSTRAGLLYDQGCNQLWSRLDASTGKQLLLDMSRLHSFVDDSALQNLKALLDELLKKQTSFSEFLLSEMILGTIVMACLILLNTLQFQEISKSLRLQSSEDQLLAVSQILDRLCDATCQLSRNYNICSCSSKLDAILRMSSTAQRGMEGVDFCGIISSKDERESFKAFIDQGVRDGFNDALYLDLNGASSMRVRMQLLCARFADIRGHPRVLCGLTEIQADRPHHGPASAADSFGPLPGPRPGRRRRRSSNADASSDAASDSASDSASDGGNSNGSDGGKSNGGADTNNCEVEVELDDELRIVSISRAFEKFLGARLSRSPDASLRPFLKDPEVFPELARRCAEGAGTDEVGVRFNTLAREGGVVYSMPYKAVCAVQLRSSHGAASRARLRLVAARRLQGPAGGSATSASL